MADTANMIALIAICAGASSDTSPPEICAAVQGAVEATLSQLASSYFGPMTPSALPSTTYPANTSGASNALSISTTTETTVVTKIEVSSSSISEPTSETSTSTTSTSGTSSSALDSCTCTEMTTVVPTMSNTGAVPSPTGATSAAHPEVPA